MFNNPLQKPQEQKTVMPLTIPQIPSVGDVGKMALDNFLEGIPEIIKKIEEKLEKHGLIIDSIELCASLPPSITVILKRVKDKKIT